jgi:photosystem II stability/assembly factor-like uncharacterized protein
LAAGRRTAVALFTLALICAFEVLVLTAARKGASATDCSLRRVSDFRSAMEQRRRRDAYFAGRRGLWFGMPQHAFRRAIYLTRRTGLLAPSRAMAPQSATPLEGENGSDPPGGFAWNFIGPEPILDALANFGGTFAGAGFDATGRIAAIAADSSTPGRIFVGAANGGVWMSTDDGASFRAIGDSLPSLAIGAIALDSVNTDPPTIYVGTGEGNSSADSYYGIGIFRSADLGANWSDITFGMLDRSAIAKLALDLSKSPPVVFAAASGGFSASRADAGVFVGDPSKWGIWRTSDGGSTWLHIAALLCGPSANSPCPVSDAAVDPQNPSNVYIAVGGVDVFVSTDGGDSYTPACFTNDSPCTFPQVVGQMGRQSIAVGPPASRAPLNCSQGSARCGVVYAMLGAPDGKEYFGFFMSTDGGATWASRNVPSWLNPEDGVSIDGTSSRHLSQSDYDQVLMVDNADSSGQTVLFGGVGIYESTDAGSTWSFLARNGGTHSDQHALAIGPDQNTVYVGNDGGAYTFSLSAIRAGVATFSSLNAALPVAQIQAIGPHPTDNTRLLAGFQDNGTSLFSGAVGWNQVETGEGGFTLFDRSNPSLAYHTFATTDHGPSVSRSTDGGQTWDFSDPSDSLDSLLNATRDTGANLYPPLAGDPSISGRVLFGAHGVYISTDAMMTWQAQESADLTAGCADGTCALEDIEFFPGNHAIAWAVAMANAKGFPFRLWNTTEADCPDQPSCARGQGKPAIWNDLTAALPFDPAVTQATGISLDPANAKIAYLSLSGFSLMTGVGHVFQTMDFGTSWHEADGAGGSSPLPDVPVLRLLVDSSDASGSTVYAATDIGVYRSTDSGNDWSGFILGVFPQVPAFDIEQNLNGTIFVGTHGRGVFQLVKPSTSPTPSPSMTLASTPTTTATASSTATATPSITATRTGTATATPTGTPSATATRTATASATAKLTATPSATPTATATASATSTPTPSPTPTPTSTATATPSASASSTPTRSATAGGTPTATTTATTTATRTATSAPTPTATLAATSTPTQTAAPTASATPSTTATATFTATPKPTAVRARVSVHPNSLRFGGQIVLGSLGVASKPRNLTIVNAKNRRQTQPVMIEGIGTKGDFSVPPNSCIGPLMPGAQCVVPVTFTPTHAGRRSGILRIIGKARNLPRKILLVGTGVRGKLALSPRKLNFSTVSTGHTSIPRDVTLTNPNAVMISLDGFKTSAGFEIVTNTCGKSLDPDGGRCSLSIAFNPKKRGFHVGAVWIRDDAAGSPQRVRLTGSGR